MKKGFTLIELLAVIVILAIIALIAIPQFAKVIDGVKMDAGARSVEGHIGSVDNELAKGLLKGQDYNDGEIFSLNSIGVNVKKNVTCTSYTLKGNTIVEASNCTSNGYTYSYSIEKGAYILSGSKGNKSNIYASANGRLHVSGSKLYNSKGEEFKLMGAGLAGGTIYRDAHHEYTKDAFATLKSWGANVTRVWIIGKGDYSGAYSYYDNKDEYMEQLFASIDNAIANDLYVIVVWASCDSNDDPMYTEAKEAFERVANRYPNDYHILYELWNEPHGATTWDQIVAFSNKIIPDIRSISPDSIIISGTPDYDKRVDLVLNNRLQFNNIMYAHHLYMGSMSNTLLGYFQQAIDAGLPMVETEWAGVEGGVPKGNYLNDANAYAYARLLKKYNISNLMFCFHATEWSYGFVLKGQWDKVNTGNLPDSILRENALFFKKILKDDYSTDKYLMREIKSNEYYKATEWRDKILTVTFKNKLNVPKNAVVSWDLSMTGDGTVIGYLTDSDTSGMYNLVICSNGYTNLPMDSGSLFEKLTNVESYDLKYARTDLVSNMSYMFRENKKLKKLDLSMFDTSKLTFMYSTFSGDTMLESIDFTNWNPKLSGVTQTFSNCTSLKSLDLSNFDVKNAADFSQMFYNDSSLETLNISTWKPKNVKKLYFTFMGTRNLKSVDLSGFTTFNEGYDINSIFNNTNNNISIKTGNNDFKTALQAQYPSLNIQ